MSDNELTPYIMQHNVTNKYVVLALELIFLAQKLMPCIAMYISSGANMEAKRLKMKFPIHEAALLSSVQYL